MESDICECGHIINWHATGRHRSRWMCEYPNCECDDFKERQDGNTEGVPSELSNIDVPVAVTPAAVKDQG